MCRVVGCRELHLQHFCARCLCADSTHFSTDCQLDDLGALMLRRGDSCKVAGCLERHAAHYCKLCRDPDSSHRSSHCPSATQSVPVGLTAGRSSIIAHHTGSGPGNQFAGASPAIGGGGASASASVVHPSRLPASVPSSEPRPTIVPPAVADDQCCLVCLERQWNVVFNCGHCTCDTCSLALRECPTCRSIITRTTKIHGR